MDDTFSSLEATFGLSATLNPTGIAIAIGVALLSRAFKLHDKISNLLKIRQNFDVDNILVPLADAVGFSPTPAQLISIKQKRHALMRAVFYKYASSRAENPLIDKHDIEHAMDSWSWFWWPVEATAFVLIAFITAVVFWDISLMIIFAIASIVLVIIAVGLYLGLKNLAQPQVETIAADQAAKAAVLSEFNAL